MIYIGGKDKIFNQLLNASWSKRLAIFSIVSFLAIIPLCLSWFDGTFINQSLKIDALHDYGYWNQFVVLLPFLTLFIPFYFDGLEVALKALKARKIVNINDVEYAEFCNDVNLIFSNKTITFGPVIIAILVYAFSLVTYWSAGLHTWNSPVKGATLNVSMILSTIPTFILYYFLSGFVFRMVSVYFVIKRFLSYEVIINPLHPDKVGGLSPLGNFSLRLTLAGIFVGFCCLGGVAANVYQYNFHLFSTPNILIILFYMIGLTIVFFVPLYSARNGMIKAKKQTTLAISNAFNEAMHDVLSELKCKNNCRKFEIEDIEKLSKLYDYADKMPIFPFNSSNVIKFFSSIVWPVALIFIDWITSKF